MALWHLIWLKMIWKQIWCQNWFKLSQFPFLWQCLQTNPICHTFTGLSAASPKSLYIRSWAEPFLHFVCLHRRSVVMLHMGSSWQTSREVLTGNCKQVPGLCSPWRSADCSQPSPSWHEGQRFHRQTLSLIIACLFKQKETPTHFPPLVFYRLVTSRSENCSYREVGILWFVIPS